MTHSCERIIRESLFSSRNWITLSGPNFTMPPIPVGSLKLFGYIPNSLSESVGSDHKISIINYYSKLVTS